MRACANCGHENRPGVFFCENCGASLIGKSSRDTNSLQTRAASSASGAPADAGVVTDTRVEGRSTVREGDKLKLDIEGSPEPVTVSATQEIIFGRRDPATGALPDVDLTPHAGYRMGVSRRHAAIRPGAGSALDLWDLGSSNGTFLNGQRLSAHRPYRLHDGDELRLGQMAIRVRFETAAETVRVASKSGELGAAPGPALEAEPQKEPPSTEPIYALIAMLRDQDTAAQTGGAVPTTEPLPELAKEAPAPPAAEKLAEPAASEPASVLPTDKIATEEAAPVVPNAPAAEKPAPATDPAAPPSSAIAPPAPLPKSSNGPAAAEVRAAPNAVPIFPAKDAPTAPRNGQSSSAALASPAPAAPEAKVEPAPPATPAQPAADEKPPEAPDAPKPLTPPTPPAPTES